MSNSTENLSIRRLAGVTLFIGVPALLVAYSVLGVLQISEDNLSVSEKQTQIAALARRASLTSRNGKPVDLSAIYIPGASRSLANANLQQLLVDAVSAASGKLIETAVTDPTDTTDPVEASGIRLKVTLDIDNGGLLQFLYRIESGVPLIDIETLSIRRLPDDGENGRAEMLRIDVDVKGRWKRSAV